MPPEPFSLAFERDHPFGVLAGVHLPPGKTTVPEEILGRLAPEEQSVARALRGYKQTEWVGGRLAWRALARRLGQDKAPLLVDATGAPIAPAGTSVSVSHKRDLAVVLASTTPGATVGIDLEDDTAAAESIAHLVFGAEERAAFEALHEWRDRAKVLAFSVKEAIYKALAPTMKRSLRYEDAVVWVGTGGVASVTMHLAGDARQPEVELSYEWRAARVMTAVRCITRATPSLPTPRAGSSPRRS